MDPRFSELSSHVCWFETASGALDRADTGRDAGPTVVSADEAFRRIPDSPGQHGTEPYSTVYSK